MKKIIFFCFLIHVLYRCSPIKDSDSPLIDKVELQLRNDEYKMKLSEIVDSIKYIPLETNDKSLLGDIDRIIVTEDGNYLIADKEIASAVFLFTSQGQFVRQIGNRGDSPDEYLKIEDMAYYDHKVYIWDSANRKVLEYNIEGELLSTFKFEYAAYYFSCTGEKEFAFFCDYAHNQKLLNKGKLPNLIKYNANNNEWDFDLFFDEQIPSQAYLLSLNNLSGNNLYSAMDDTIYQVTSDLVKRKYVLDYKENYKKNRKEYLSQFKPGNSDSYFSSEKMFPQLITYFECDRVNVFFLRLGEYLHYAFYYPDSNLCKEASSKGCPITNDIDNAASFFIRYARENILYSVLEPEVLIEKEPRLSEKLNIKVDDNLLLVKMFIKK